MDSARQFLAWVCVFVVCGFLGGLIAHFVAHERAGIINNPAGTAVYLDGEACVVNYNPDFELFQTDLVWCLDTWKPE